MNKRKLHNSIQVGMDVNIAFLFENLIISLSYSQLPFPTCCLQLLTRLVFDRGSTDAAAKVVEIMSADFVHEVISADLSYPPRSGHGWGQTFQ